MSAEGEENPATGQPEIVDPTPPPAGQETRSDEVKGPQEVNFERDAGQRANRIIYNTYLGGSAAREQRRRDDSVSLLTALRALLTEFVPPEYYPHLTRSLAERHLVILNGKPGNGKFSSAIASLVHFTDPEKVLEVDPKKSMAILRDEEWKRGHCYLMHHPSILDLSADEDHSIRFVADELRRCGALLLVVTDHPASSFGKASRDRIIEAAPPDCLALVRKRLGRDLTDPELGRVAEIIVAALKRSDSIPTVEKYVTITEAVHSDPSIADDPQRLQDLISGDGSKRADEDIEAWFSGSRTEDDFSLMITLSVFADAPIAAISTAEALLREIMPPEERTETAKQPSSRFGDRVRSRNRYERCGAVIVDDRVNEDRTVVKTVEFKDPDWRAAALRYLWGAPDLRDDLATFIYEAGKRFDPALQVFAGRAVAELCHDEFGTIARKILEPWAADPNVPAGQSAGFACDWLMSIDGRQNDTRILVEKWSRNGNPNVTWTAVAACEWGFGEQYPVAALAILRRVMSGNKTPWKAITSSLASILQHGDANALHCLLAFRHWLEEPLVTDGKKATADETRYTRDHILWMFNSACHEPIDDSPDDKRQTIALEMLTRNNFAGSLSEHWAYLFGRSLDRSVTRRSAGLQLRDIVDAVGRTTIESDAAGRLLLKAVQAPDPGVEEGRLLFVQSRVRLSAEQSKDPRPLFELCEVLGA